MFSNVSARFRPFIKTFQTLFFSTLCPSSPKKQQILQPKDYLGLGAFGFFIIEKNSLQKSEAWNFTSHG
jgi:hypothetical protein